MQVLVNSDHNIVGTEELTEHVERVVHGTLGRFGERITRVEVHLTDENSTHKQGENDKRCMMEARLRGLKPIAVTQLAATLPEAIDGAAEKLERALDSMLGRLDETKGRTPSTDEIASIRQLDRLDQENQRGT